jgi:hypothetical protein
MDRLSLLLNRKRMALGVFVLVSLAAAGCGGGSGPTSSARPERATTEFAAATDAICQHARKESKAITDHYAKVAEAGMASQRARTEAGEIIAEAVPFAKNEATKIAALDAPMRFEKDRDEIVAAFAHLTTANEKLSHAFEVGSSVGVERWLKKSSGYSEDVSAIAKRLGLTVCGKRESS